MDAPELPPLVADQVDVEFQLPVFTEYLVAANEAMGKINNTTNKGKAHFAGLPAVNDPLCTNAISLRQKVATIESKLIND